MNGELVLMDGSDWQVVTLGLETGLIGGPSQSEFLAFGRDPVRGSFVGVAHNVLVSCFAVRIVRCALHLLLHLGLFTGGVIRSGIAVTYTQSKTSLECVLEIENEELMYLHLLLPSRLRSSDWLTMVIPAYLLSL